MATINGVDFGKVAQEAIAAAKAAADDPQVWKSLQDIIHNIADSLQADVALIARRKATGEFNESDAKIFLDDQKMVARIRIRSIASIGLTAAENIWNAVANVFGTAINKALGWTLL